MLSNFSLAGAILRFTHTQEQINALLVFAARQNRVSLLKSAIQAGGDLRYANYRALLLASRLENKEVLDVIHPLLSSEQDNALLGTTRERKQIIAALDPLDTMKRSTKCYKAAPPKKLRYA